MDRRSRAQRARRPERTFLGYRTLYACIAVVLLATGILILAQALPNVAVLGWVDRTVGELPILGGMAVLLGIMALLLVHARQITLMHLTVIRKNMDAILLTRTDGSIITANPAACALTGYSYAELRAGGRKMMLYPDDPEAEALYRRRDETGSVRGELWMRKKDGTRIRVELSSVVFEFKGEQRTAMIVRDVSQTYQSEYERTIAQTVFEDISQVVCVLDQEWRILWANQATERISGYPRDELIGHTAPLRRCLENEAPDRLAKIQHALDADGNWTGEVYTRRKGGELYPLYGTMTGIESLVPGQLHYVATFSDVSAVRDYERKLRDVLQYDPITTLPNRVLFEETVQQALGSADPETDTLALLLLDIDDFRTINESFGHQTGDRMLRAAALRLTEHLGERAFSARHTGDGFAILLADLADIEEAGLIASDLVTAFQTGFEEGPNGQIGMTVGIGVAGFPDDGSSSSALLRHAEIALGMAKQSGGDTYRLYTEGAENHARRFVALAANMRDALELDEFVAHFQPIMDTGSGRIVSMETLARWPASGATMIGPAEFIPAAERSGLIGRLSEHMLRQACAHLRALDRAGFHRLSAGVNLSARQFRDERLAERILEILDQERTPTSSIVLEITESLLMDEPEDKRKILERMQAGGLRVVMDDFGTGYSSLSYLKHFELDGIKMDRSFTQHLPYNPKDAAIVRTILAIGHELNLPVVAEGIETSQQARFLKQCGCHRLQGNLIGLPMSSADFLDYLEKRPVPAAID